MPVKITLLAAVRLHLTMKNQIMSTEGNNQTKKEAV